LINQEEMVVIVEIWRSVSLKGNRARLALLLGITSVFAAAVRPASASILTITPTFDSTITSDPNAAAIEGTINTAINFYQTTFTTNTASPINVTIDFQEINTVLGQTNTTPYDVGYQAFINALIGASSGDATDTTALSHLPAGPINPVTGTTDFLVKTATLRALGFNGASFPPIGGFDGTIGLNTHFTTPGSPGSPLAFSLLAVTEHEIDEVLGLGSSLPYYTMPSPEDLFRYTNTGTRSFTTNGTAVSFFSVDGTTDLAQFDNQNDGGDFGDWQSNPLPNGVGPKVQDAYATQGANPSLSINSPEVIALDAMGYNLATPEPASMFLAGLALAGMVIAHRKRLIH
jgi:hypothetical protein